MKFYGKKPKGPDEQIVVFPRTDMDIGFVVRGVVDYDAFNALCPFPKAPQVRLPGDKFRDDVENPVFKAQMQEYSRKQSQWMLIESIRYTPGLEFEDVVFSDPETWGMLEAELAGLSLNWVERQTLMIAIHQVNGINEERIQEARMRFLATLQQEKNGQSSPTVEQPNTSTGDAVSDGELSQKSLKEQPAGTI